MNCCYLCGHRGLGCCYFKAGVECEYIRAEKERLEKAKGDKA